MDPDIEENDISQERSLSGISCSLRVMRNSGMRITN